MTILLNAPSLLHIEPETDPSKQKQKAAATKESKAGTRKEQDTPMWQIIENEIEKTLTLDRNDGFCEIMLN